MAVSLKHYSDAALTTEITTLAAEQDVDGTIPPVQSQVYFGSVVANRRFRANSNPGVDQIVLSVVDANGAAGEPVTAAKLALTQAGLASATPGAALNLGTEILSGAASAVSVWIEIDDQTAAVGVYTDLSFQLNTIREEATA